MKPITFINPKRLAFGNGCIEQLFTDIQDSDYEKIFLVAFPQILPSIESIIERIRTSGKRIAIDDSIVSEPTIETLEAVLNNARAFNAECVVGIGGGSVLDVAKLVAALCDNFQTTQDVIGIGKLNSRSKKLICLPTTSGTGSEMSPNAIILDKSDQQKKGVISPFLVPDASYIDPLLTMSVPPSVTAATGMDAMSHCLEAYANKFAHPVVDLYALEGIRLVASNLKRAYDNGEDEKARANLALASVYGGMCLGPVNTAAVHAIAYPLGSEFHIAHGLSIAVLLPYVMEFNISAAPRRFAEIGLALGAEKGSDDFETAYNGVQKLQELNRDCGIPNSLQQLKIPKEAIESIVGSVLKVTRLLKNNLREVKANDIRNIYEIAF